MKGFNYKSCLTYPFNRPISEMKSIIEKDSFQISEINEELKIVTYTIDNSKSIKLSYLLQFIEVKFLKLSLAQFIQLGIDIYNKYKYLVQNQIQHKYLSSDRVYLTVQNEQSAFSILPGLLKYSINFTGYDCPFYELENYEFYQKSDGQSIKEIITNIIQIAIKQFNLRNNAINEQPQNDRCNIQNKEVIYQKIYIDGICRSLDSFYINANEIFEKFNNYENQQQLLNGIDLQFDKNVFWRNKRLQKVNENIQTLIQKNYQIHKWYKTEYLLLQTLPLIIKEVKESYFYQQQILDQYKNFKNLQFIIGCVSDQDCNSIIDRYLQKAKEKYKFHIDKSIIYQNTISQIHIKFKCLNYFYNNIQFQTLQDQKILNQIESIKKKLLEQIVEEKMKEQIESNIIRILEEMF
ncbi:unnamed protein product [Paramecium sonneborni]|uniref:Uncharacterized protein n=1 Tax=Paramecium sonneborni TaxID=65129 RepID=A0A8S1LIT4_9CILI|nr:unnamed protein product [Paramecium sonneborni]